MYKFPISAINKRCKTNSSGKIKVNGSNAHTTVKKILVINTLVFKNSEKTLMTTV